MTTLGINRLISVTSQDIAYINIEIVIGEVPFSLLCFCERANLWMDCYMVFYVFLQGRMIHVYAYKDFFIALIITRCKLISSLMRIYDLCLFHICDISVLLLCYMKQGTLIALCVFMCSVIWNSSWILNR